MLDQFLQLEPSQRMLTNVIERLIKEAIESSYKKAGENAAYGVEISKKTVMHEIENLELKREIIETKIEKKKQVKTSKNIVYHGR